MTAAASHENTRNAADDGRSFHMDNINRFKDSSSLRGNLISLTAHKVLLVPWTPVLQAFLWPRRLLSAPTRKMQAFATFSTFDILLPSLPR